MIIFLRSIFKKGGSVVDVAIATLFCEGIADPQSLGIGGGFVSTIYIRSTGEVISLIARETAPLAAHESMFVNQSVTGSFFICFIFKYSIKSNIPSFTYDKSTTQVVLQSQFQVK